MSKVKGKLMTQQYKQHCGNVNQCFLLTKCCATCTMIQTSGCQHTHYRSVWGNALQEHVFDKFYLL